MEKAITHLVINHQGNQASPPWCGAALFQAALREDFYQYDVDRPVVLWVGMLSPRMH